MAPAATGTRKNEVKSSSIACSPNRPPNCDSKYATASMHAASAPASIGAQIENGNSRPGFRRKLQIRFILAGLKSSAVKIDFLRQALQQCALVPAIPAFDDAPILKSQPGHASKICLSARGPYAQGIALVGTAGRPPHNGVFFIGHDGLD